MCPWHVASVRSEKVTDTLKRCAQVCVCVCVCVYREGHRHLSPGSSNERSWLILQDVVGRLHTSQYRLASG